MAIALLASTSAGAVSGGDITTPAIDTTGASLIVIGVSWYQNITADPTITDSVGSTIAAGTRVQPDDFIGRLFYVSMPTTNAAYTVTLSGSLGFGALAVAAFSDAVTLINQSTGSAPASVTSLANGSLNPLVANTVFVTSLACRDGGAPDAVGIDQSFTIVETVPEDPGNHLGVSLAYLLLPGSPGARNPTWSWTTSSRAATEMMTFVSGGGGGATSPGYTAPFGWT